jgi:Uma2 family endonuclease
MVVGAERYLFSIEEFDRLFEVGFFTEDDRIEFVDGELIRMSSVSGDHLWPIVRLDRAIQRVIPDSLAVSVQNPIRIANRASFIPDIAVVRIPARGQEVPSAESVLLTIEVSKSSRAYDQNTKLPMYASAGIPEAWILDLVDDRIERHTDPRDGAYQQVAVAERGEQLASLMLPALTFDVDTILGPREIVD